jgi:hypothetical protein
LRSSDFYVSTYLSVHRIVDAVRVSNVFSMCYPCVVLILIVHRSLVLSFGERRGVSGNSPEDYCRQLSGSIQLSRRQYQSLAHWGPRDQMSAVVLLSSRGLSCWIVLVNDEGSRVTALRTIVSSSAVLSSCHGVSINRLFIEVRGIECLLSYCLAHVVCLVGYWLTTGGLVHSSEGYLLYPPSASQHSPRTYRRRSDGIMVCFWFSLQVKFGSHRQRAYVHCVSFWRTGSFIDHRIPLHQLSVSISRAITGMLTISR